ncbi:hypothetical protein ABZ319_01670 [Nocardia sp. NPDC005978]|uniref:hypothetical protein n=1 Tax=Nocardia sp. NPDC005978 TaxID=3156725 RepID=UPI0033A01B11
MGNHFSADSVGLDVYMTNGGTDVFCDVIALAGSSIASTAWQRNLVLHFCDLVRYGRGTGGFDLAEVPWTHEHRSEQDFFIEMLDRANHRTGWQKLHYTPAIDHILGAFTRMLTTFDPGAATDSGFGDWTVAPRPYLVDLCDRHTIFPGSIGCRLCDTFLQPTDAPLVWELISTYNDGGSPVGEVVDRRIQQINDDLISRVLPITGDPGPRAVGIEIQPALLEQVSAIIGQRIDPRARHWLGRAVA